MSPTRRTVLQMLGVAAVGSHLTGLLNGAPAADAAAVAAVQSPPSYAAIVGLL